jgi:hypothetical protein
MSFLKYPRTKCPLISDSYIYIIQERTKNGGHLVQGHFRKDILNCYRTQNPPENDFYVFSNALLSECNLSLIFEQVTMGSRVPRTRNPPGFRVLRNGKRTWVLGSAFSGTGNPYSTGSPGFRIPKNGEPGKIRSLRSFENRVPIHKNPSGFRVLGNGEPIVDFAFPVPGNATRN